MTKGDTFASHIRQQRRFAPTKFRVGDKRGLLSLRSQQKNWLERHKEGLGDHRHSDAALRRKTPFRVI
ncbi:MAG TPA: hypothetical protein VHX39_13200 [Acetobacteraceae bacterium]|jgi:hypothetical protein|nr:hypothetical protein [Acetobacteraceae bacterium]